MLQADGGDGGGGGLGRVAVKLPHLWLTGEACLSRHITTLTQQQQQQHHLPQQQHHLPQLPDPRPYACTFCGRRFKRSDHRRQHERLHTGEKPYVCPVCGAKFAQQSGLHYHKINACRGVPSATPIDN